MQNGAPKKQTVIWSLNGLISYYPTKLRTSPKQGESVQRVGMFRGSSEPRSPFCWRHGAGGLAGCQSHPYGGAAVSAEPWRPRSAAGADDDHHFMEGMDGDGDM
jgi:hypothetical protein